MPVTFYESSGDSPKYSLSSGKPQWVRTGTVAWSEVDAFIAEAIPPSSSFGASAGGVAGIAFPGNPVFRASSVTVEPLGRASGGTSNGGALSASALSYDMAKVTLTYTVPEGGGGENDDGENEGDPVPFLTHDWQVGGEWLTLPKWNLKWFTTCTQPVPEEANTGILVETIEHSITWAHVLYPPFDAIRACMGKVNSQRMQFATGFIYKESLLFLGAQLSREIMSDGVKAWKVGYKFSERLVFPPLDQDAEEYADTFPPLLNPDNDEYDIERGSGGWNHFWRDTANPADGTTDKRTGWFRLVRTDDLTGACAASGTGFGGAGALDIYELIDLGILFNTQTQG